MTSGTTPTTLWAEITELVVRNQVTPLADRLIALGDAERGEIAARLPGLVKELRRRVTEGARTASVTATSSGNRPPGRSTVCSTIGPGR